MASDPVSVVIVCHNNWPDLELAIQSALHQSYQPVEVIVVDNASSDETPIEVPRRFGNVVRYIRQPNLGDGGGYNTGMRTANGEFIQFLDGDDFLAADKLEKQIEVFRADPSVDIVYGDLRNFQGPPGVAREWRDTDMCAYDDMLAALAAPDDNNLMIQAMLYRRSALDRIGEWDDSLYLADCDYLFRAAWAGCRFRYCPGSLFFYRRRPGQMSSDSSAMLRGFEQVLSKALVYITTEPYRSGVRARLARARFGMAVHSSGLTRRRALAKLAEARATSPETISAFGYALAAGCIVIPGVRRLVIQPWLRPIRRWLEGFINLRDFS